MRVTRSTRERYEKFLKSFGLKICRELAAGSNRVAGCEIDATASG
jgi:putative cell wall-binding protein